MPRRLQFIVVVDEPKHHSRYDVGAYIRNAVRWDGWDRSTEDEFRHHFENASVHPIGDCEVSALPAPSRPTGRELHRRKQRDEAWRVR